MHAIRRSHKEFGHVQEVIVQNFRAKEHTAMASAPDTGIEEFLATMAVTRLVLGPKMRIQAPPNLVSRSRMPGADRRRGRRLGRRVAADTRPRQPGATVARAGRTWPT